MITRVEINGFKSFRDFSVDLLPFQVFIGPNSAGKSNFFDAIILLSNLMAAEGTLYDAFRKGRGDIIEQFGLMPSGERTDEIVLAVEMLVDKVVADNLGVEAALASTRLRYEIKIARRENALELVEERLNAISEDNDSWTKASGQKKYVRPWVIRKKRRPLISTGNHETYLHQDGGKGGNKLGRPKQSWQKPILSTINSAIYPTAYAARQEMLNWRFFQFDPVNLRKPSSIYAPDQLVPDGSNLARVLYRMSQDSPETLAEVSITMANLVSNMKRIMIEPVPVEQYGISAQTVNGTLSAEVLSDGTLRMLALAALKFDPKHQGVLCFEEPENGVHPLNLERVVKLLHETATDFNEDDSNKPLRQVLINTHSPALLHLVHEKFLLYVEAKNTPAGSLTHMARVTNELLPDNITIQEQTYTKAKIEKMLNTVSGQYGQPVS